MLIFLNQAVIKLSAFFGGNTTPQKSAFGIVFDLLKIDFRSTIFLIALTKNQY